MNDFLSQIQSDELSRLCRRSCPTEAQLLSVLDWSDYCDYLDSIGFDAEDDGPTEDDDPTEGRGFQPWNGDTIMGIEDDCPW